MQKLILVTSFVFFLAKITFSQVEPRLVLPVGHTGYLQNVDISHDEKYVIFSSGDGSISLWDYQQQKLLRKFTHAAGIPVKCKFIKGSHEFVSYCEGYGEKEDQTNNIIKLWSIDQENQSLKNFDFNKHVTREIRGVFISENKDLLIIEPQSKFIDSLIFLNISTDEIRKIPKIAGFSDIISVLNNRIVIETLKIDYPFQTHSDCEIILALYEQKGEDFLNDLQCDP
jgi:hypothetical protein